MCQLRMAAAEIGPAKPVEVMPKAKGAATMALEIERPWLLRLMFLSVCQLYLRSTAKRAYPDIDQKTTSGNGFYCL